ncbi:MAG: hypothetical protein ACK56F_07355, partial [bacterium]
LLTFSTSHAQRHPALLTPTTRVAHPCSRPPRLTRRPPLLTHTAAPAPDDAHHCSSQPLLTPTTADAHY